MNWTDPEKFIKMISLSRLTLFVIMALLLSPANQVQAQNSQWSFPQTIPSYDLDSAPPILVVDSNNTVHAFSTQWITAGDDVRLKVVVYNRWTLEYGWTPPIDIVSSPIKEARVTDAYLDDSGIFHLAFWGGDGTDADIYYSKSPVDSVDSARSWSKPIVVGDEAGDPEGAVFVKNDQGEIILVFNSTQYGNGLYAVTSSDNGDTWSFPIPIFIANIEAPNIYFLRAIHSESGWLHAVWNVYNAGGQGRGIYYTRSADGESWDQPTLLADAQEGLGTQTPALVEYMGNLSALYILPPKIIMRMSTDNGETWLDPVILFSRHIGVNGSLSLVVDSNEDLHLLFGQRISGSPDIHGMWHSAWVNNRWTEPDAVIKGPQVNDLTGYGSFDPNSARAVVSRGNVILVTWRTDPGFKGNGVWFSYKKVDAPELPAALPGSTQPDQSAALEPSISPGETPSLAGTNAGDITLPEETTRIPQQGGLIEGISVYVWIIVVAIMIVVVYSIRKKTSR